MDKQFDTVIKNARVVRPNKTSVDCLDIAIKDGKIAHARDRIFRPTSPAKSSMPRTGSHSQAASMRICI